MAQTWRPYSKGANMLELSIPDELRKLNTFMHVFGENEDGEPIKRPRIAGTTIFGTKTNPEHWRGFDYVLDARRRYGGLPYLVVTAATLMR